MMRYPEAEKMHLKAIQIKESLLGKEDYEVKTLLYHQPIFILSSNPSGCSVCWPPRLLVQLRHGAVPQGGRAVPQVNQDWQEAVWTIIFWTGIRLPGPYSGNKQTKQVCFALMFSSESLCGWWVVVGRWMCKPILVFI